MSLRTTLGELLNDSAQKFKNKPFLSIAETGNMLSYGEFESLTNRFAHGLMEQELPDLSYVAILAQNGAEYLAASYALKKISAVEVSINCAMRGASLARMINQTKAQILITDTVHLDVLDQLRRHFPHLRTLIMLDGSTKARELFPELTIVRFDDVLSDRDEHIVSSAKDTDVATILFTSGTTGVSKGCLLSHRYAVRTAENMIEPFRLAEDDCSYSPYPLSHIGPAYYDVLPMMMVGGRVVFMRTFQFVQLLARG